MQAISPCNGRRLLLCTDKGRVRAGAGSWNPAGHSQTCGSIYLGLQDGWFSPGTLSSVPSSTVCWTHKERAQEAALGCAPWGLDRTAFINLCSTHFWVPFSLISEHWSQARASQNTNEQKISLLYPVCLLFWFSSWQTVKCPLKFRLWKNQDPPHVLLWAHKTSGDHHS